MCVCTSHTKDCLYFCWMIPLFRESLAGLCFCLLTMVRITSPISTAPRKGKNFSYLQLSAQKIPRYPKNSQDL